MSDEVWRDWPAREKQTRAGGEYSIETPPIDHANDGSESTSVSHVTAREERECLLRTGAWWREGVEAESPQPELQPVPNVARDRRKDLLSSQALNVCHRTDRH